MYEDRSTEYVEGKLDSMRYIMRLTFATFQKSKSAELKGALRHQLKHIDDIKRELKRRA